MLLKIVTENCVSNMKMVYIGVCVYHCSKPIKPNLQEKMFFFHFFIILLYDSAFLQPITTVYLSTAYYSLSKPKSRILCYFLKAPFMIRFIRNFCPILALFFISKPPLSLFFIFWLHLLAQVSFSLHP